MIKKRFILLIGLVSVSILFSSCYDLREPKQLALVLSALYDKSDDGTYNLTFEFLDPSSSGGGNEGPKSGSPSKTLITTSSGKNITEAISSSTQTVERTPYYAHNRVRFFSQNYAEKGISDILDTFIRDPELREFAYLVVIKGDEPQKIYSAGTGLTQSVGEFISGLSNSKTYLNSSGVFITVQDYMKSFYEDGKQPVMGLVELIENDAQPLEGETSQQVSKKYKILYNGLAAFKDNKLVGFMNSEETRAYNILTDNFNGSVIFVGGPKESTSLTLSSSNADFKIDITDNFNVIIDITIKINGAITQHNSNTDITKAQVIKDLQNQLNVKLENQISLAIKKAQSEFKSDIFGFGLSAHVQHPKLFNEIGNNWSDCFSKASINVTVESVITRINSAKQPIGLEF